ncbi:MAG: hypothetical protein U0X73_08330 [Thermoanaerobaculia bacterium]
MNRFIATGSVGRSATFVAAWWAFLFLGLRLADWFGAPDSDYFSRLVWWLVQPIPLVARFFAWVVDFLGPKNLPEPASSSLGRGAVNAFGALALIVSFSLLTLAVHVFRMRWARYRKRVPA